MAEWNILSNLLVDNSEIRQTDYTIKICRVKYMQINRFPEFKFICGLE